MSMKLYYMRDNHTFLPLPAGDVEAAMEAVRAEFARGQTYGMLCTKDRPGVLEHAGRDFAEFEPRARTWYAKVMEPTPAQVEYESWFGGEA